MTNISSFLKYYRKKLKLTQKELAIKAGVGIRFIREMEQGKNTLQLDKVNQVLSLFGFCVAPVQINIDPYLIYWKYINKSVKITLIDKTIKYGIILKEIFDNKSKNITAWEFLSNKNAIKYQKNKDIKLIEIILHTQIQKVEE